MSKAKTILRDAGRFTASGYISSIANFLSAVAVRRILSPFFMGIYAELSVIFEYAKYNHFGILDSLDRQIPYYNGRGESERTEEVKNIGISFSLLTSTAVALFLILFSYLFRNRLSPSLFIGLKVIAIMVVVQSMSTFYVTLVRTHHLFVPLSKYLVLIALFDIFFKIILGLKFGVIGILWATVFTLITGMVYLFRTAKLRFRLTLRMPKKIVAALLKIGFPLLLAGFTFMALRSVDRIMIIALLTKEDLGYYSIAIMMFSFVFQLPNLMYTVLFPRFYEAFGSAKSDLSRIRGYVEKPTLAFAYLFPVLIGIAVIILPVFVRYVLPKYVQGITPAVILLFGTVCISFTNMSGYLLVALKKQGMLVLIGALCVLTSAFLNLIFVKILNLGIVGIALGTAITYFLYSIFLIGYAIKHYTVNLYEKIKFFTSLYVPLLWVLFIFYIFRFIFHRDSGNLSQDVFGVLLQMAVFVVLTFPLLFIANKKLDLIKRIKDARGRK